MDFGAAIAALTAGERVSRAGWNGKNMWLFYVADWDASPEITYPTQPFIAMKTAVDTVVPWLASQTDILAEDWEMLV